MRIDAITLSTAIYGAAGDTSIDILKDKSTIEKGLPRAMILNDNVIDYVHWDDPNELVDRMQLLEASRHNAHDNEMLLIIEELREASIIIN